MRVAATLLGLFVLAMLLLAFAVGGWIGFFVMLGACLLWFVGMVAIG